MNEKYRAIYAAVYRFHERNINPDWDRVYADMRNVAAQFGDDPFVVALLLDVFEELERSDNTRNEGRREK